MTYEPRRVARREHRVLRGLRHQLHWWGDDVANPIVLLHGWGDSSETWQFLVDRLPESWTCVGLDWRGFGGTAWSQQGYWFPDYFADLEALLDELCPGTPVRVIAHSMGGNIATMYGGMRTGRIEWLVNLEGIGLRQLPADHAPDRYVEWLDQLRTPTRERRYATLDVLVDFLVARNPAMPREHAEFLAHAWSAPDADARGGLKLVFDPRHRNVNPTLFQRPEAEALWKRFTAPMLLVLGEGSEIRGRVSPEHMTNEYFRSMFRDLRIQWLAGVGHMMHIENPQAIAQLAIDFAQSLSARQLLPRTGE
jgi:pimeloyl-ACP methyl ester carboxylesterase